MPKKQLHTNLPENVSDRSSALSTHPSKSPEIEQKHYKAVPTTVVYCPEDCIPQTIRTEAPLIGISFYITWG